MAGNLFVVAMMLLGMHGGAAWAAETGRMADSQCVQCHTNLKKLIRLCWEVEKSRPGAAASTETSGEG